MAKRVRKSSQEALRRARELISPGTLLREGISAILQSGTGALICVGPLKKLTDISEGGVKVDVKLTPKLLYELCKMDGAIILNDDASKIVFVNRFLKPDTNIPSEETGTRHRAAERVAREAKCTVIAVSQRRSSVTLYAHDIRRVMDSVPTLLNKAQQVIQTIEKYSTNLRQTLSDLTVREFQDIVTIFDVCRCVQRMEMLRRMVHEIEPYVVDLGTEGRLIELQVQEMLQPLEEAALVVRDYYRSKDGTEYDDALRRVQEISEDDLLNLNSISAALGHGPNMRNVETYIPPRGYRVLTGTHRLQPQIIENLVGRFGSLQQILRAPKEELCDVDGVGEVLAERIRVSLNLLHNQLTLDRQR